MHRVLHSHMTFTFITPSQAALIRENRPDMHLFDVSSYGNLGRLSPFSYSKEYKIPIPGRNDVAHSVESIWQGLKIINGSIDERMFKKRPRKRRGKPTGHQYGSEVLNLEDARREIYVPSYSFYVKNHCSDLIDDLLSLDGQVYIHDVEENSDLSVDKPLAHASLLAFYLNHKKQGWGN